MEWNFYAKCNVWTLVFCTKWLVKLTPFSWNHPFSLKVSFSVTMFVCLFTCVSVCFYFLASQTLSSNQLLLLLQHKHITLLTSFFCFERKERKGSMRKHIHILSLSFFYSTHFCEKVLSFFFFANINPDKSHVCVCNIVLTSVSSHYFITISHFIRGPCSTLMFKL